MQGEAYDYIVIGAGSAGCLMANRLSQDPANSVLLVEAGSKDNYPWIHIPIGYLYCINNPRTDWCFRTQGEAGLNGRSLLYPRGKTLGGCSSINGMIYMRGQSRDYDSWAEQTGEPAWNWQNVLPDFKKHLDHFLVESDPSNSDEFHCQGGEWRVESQRLRWQVLDAFADAAEQNGIPKTDDFNRGDNNGVGYFHVNQKRGWRWNTAKAFIHPVRHRKNLSILTQSQVRQLIFEPSQQGPVCTGVSIVSGNQQHNILAKKEVVLCAGAIGTPQLLQLSGVGDRALLKKQGIAEICHLPGVGENLQDHLQIRAVYEVSGVNTLNEMASSWLGKLKIGLEYALFRRGPMSMAPSQLGVFTRSDENKTHPNLQFHVQPLSLDAFGQPLHNFPAITASVANLNPTSRGWVRIQDADYRQAPLIQPNYLSTEEDKKVAADSLRVVRDICSQPAMQRYQPKEVKPGLDYQTDQQLWQSAGDIGTTIFHPVGTTKMGKPDDSMAVVDGRLKVMGVKRLRIADAGVMPTITSGNTNSPTMMIAEKAAAWILAGS